MSAISSDRRYLGFPVQVRGDPGTVLKLRCLFLKMRSLLEVPLLRMGQARSPALAATSRVYSSALVAFSRRLLQAGFFSLFTNSHSSHREHAAQ